MAADWRAQALCGQIGPELFTGDSNTGEDAQAAKRVCRRCPVQQTCLETALAEESGKPSSSRAGIRGGASPRQRARMKQHAA
ncbi:WhiB family transcriptional regulator [Streptomyces fenghuangensis]